jgi:hypothetical protein
MPYFSSSKRRQRIAFLFQPVHMRDWIALGSTYDDPPPPAASQYEALFPPTATDRKSA